MRLYKIENTETGEAFIGIGEQGMFLDKCFSKHKEKPDLCPPLGQAIEEYGDETFETSVIEFQKDRDTIYMIERQLEEIEKLGEKVYNNQTPPLAKMFDLV